MFNADKQPVAHGFDKGFRAADIGVGIQIFEKSRYNADDCNQQSDDPQIFPQPLHAADLFNPCSDKNRKMQLLLADNGVHRDGNNARNQHFKRRYQNGGQNAEHKKAATAAKQCQQSHPSSLFPGSVDALFFVILQTVSPHFSLYVQYRFIITRFVRFVNRTKPLVYNPLSAGTCRESAETPVPMIGTGVEFYSPMTS